MLKQMLSTAALASGLMLAMNTQAVEIEVNLYDPDNSGFWGSAYEWSYQYGNDLSNEMTVQATAWTNRSSWGDTRITQDLISDWGNSGLGVEYANTPDHAIDNAKGKFDAVLLSFSEAVTLESITAGWVRDNSSWRSDASVLAFTGNLNGESIGSTIQDKQWGDLVAADGGWSSAGNYRLSESGVVNSDAVSQYWLVGAFNPSFGGSQPGNYGYTEDFFKLKSVTASVNPVPLPGSMLLFGAGLLGFGVIRRKRNA